VLRDLSGEVVPASERVAAPRVNAGLLKWASERAWTDGGLMADNEAARLSRQVERAARATASHKRKRTGPKSGKPRGVIDDGEQAEEEAASSSDDDVERTVPDSPTVGKPLAAPPRPAALQPPLRRFLPAPVPLTRRLVLPAAAPPPRPSVRETPAPSVYRRLRHATPGAATPAPGLARAPTPSAPARWRLKGSVRVPSEPSPRVRAESTPGASTRSGKTPYKTPRRGSRELPRAPVAERRRRLVVQD